MRSVLYKALPYSKGDVTLALESGVDGIIVPDAMVKSTQSLARCRVIAESAIACITLTSKADEQTAAEQVQEAERAGSGHLVILNSGWEIIPVENLLACAPAIAAAVDSLEEAQLAAGILERGVDTIIVTPTGLVQIKDIVAAVKYRPVPLTLVPAVITAVTPAGMGHRVCVDTTSVLHSGEGMLVGNSAAFTFLVNAETEPNEYVASRPFRINAGAVHAYAAMPGDHTAYLDELAAGRQVLIVKHDGSASIATVGRVKVERRPMLLVEARIELPKTGAPGAKSSVANTKSNTASTENNSERPALAQQPPTTTGAVFLQNAETIRLVRPGGASVSVVDLKPGDTVLCRADVAGRHFGMRITEDIKEG